MQFNECIMASAASATDFLILFLRTFLLYCDVLCCIVLCCMSDRGVSFFGAEKNPP